MRQFFQRGARCDTHELMKPALLFAVAAGLLAAAQPPALERRERSKSEITAYLVRQAAEITRRAREEVTDRSKWEAVRTRRAGEMRDMLGLLPWPKRTPLNARVTGTLDKGSYTIEKLAFESFPKVYVTGNLYLPKQRKGKVPAIIYVCGHAYSPHGDKTAYQRHGISFAKNGYACLILDSIQIAEVYGMHHGVAYQEMDEWYSRAYSPAGVEVWNAMRAIDYLETRPEIDASKIGMTGRSGGAAMTLFTAPVDPRVKVAAPIMGISTYEEHVRAGTERRHCDCMFPINFLLHDMVHLSALIAPRPLLVAHGKLDLLFPVPGYTAVEQMMQALFQSYGKPEAFQNLVVDTEHKDSDFLREQALRWFDRFLLGVPDRKLDMAYTDAEPETLAVFGGKPPADAQNYRLHEILTPAAQFRTFTSRAQWESHRNTVLSTLREKVFAAFPASPAAPVVKWSGKPGDAVRDAEIVTESGIHVRVQVRFPRPVQPEKQPALLYVASDPEDDTAIASMYRAIPSGVRMTLWPRGVGEVPWEKSFWRSVQRSAMQTGRTVDSMRLWDVLRAIEVLRTLPETDPSRITLTGKGVAAGLALYAALLDKGVHQVILTDPPPSHTYGPIFLGVLRHVDMPEAVAMMAPRRVTFYARMPGVFEKARHVYALYGQPGVPGISMSVDAVLRGRYDHGFASGH